MEWQYLWTEVVFSLSAPGFQRPEDSQGQEGEKLVGMSISKLIEVSSANTGLSFFTECEFLTKTSKK